MQNRRDFERDFVSAGAWLVLDLQGRSRAAEGEKGELARSGAEAPLSPKSTNKQKRQATKTTSNTTSDKQRRTEARGSGGATPGPQLGSPGQPPCEQAFVRLDRLPLC